ncbi:unnamed protein product [Rotaria sp. Silwood1]|nr:unnamed protein product [Rotaria sp. Silwood1]CAF4696611.1 unnamed protein product [Rotaria sp. Silwood1]
MENPNPRFLTNIQDEPSNMLQPIAGYEREPLLCLEEACESLYSLINDLPQYIWISKHNCQNPEDGLTKDESASIHLYTMEWPDSQQSLYSKLNKTLRSINRQELKPWFRYLKLFLTALFKLPSIEGVVWRGVRGDLSSQYLTTNEQAWWALSSCTLSLKILESPLYLGKIGTRTLFSIETQTGRRIRSHSYFKHEEEILLLPGTFFQIISHLSPAENLHIIHLKEQQSPYPLLQLPFQGAQIRGKFREKLKNEISQQRIRRLITFADLNEKISATNNLGDIPNGYSNLRWHNVSYMHMDHALQHIKCKSTGYQYIFQNETRQHRSPYIALNSCGKSMLISSLSDDDLTFTVHTIEVQSASEDDLEIFIFGFKSNVKLFKKKVKLFIKKSTLIQLDWNNIDLITFESANDEDEHKRFHFILISIEIT